MSKYLSYCCFVSIQTFTGTFPFSNHPSFAAMLAIVQGDRPSRPTYPTFTEDVWALVQRCWDQEPRLRPEVQEALEIFGSSSVSRPFLQQLHDFDKSSSGFHDWLSAVLYGKEYRQRVPNLQGDDLVWLVDYLDEVSGRGISPRRLSPLTSQTTIGSR